MPGWGEVGGRLLVEKVSHGTSSSTEDFLARFWNNTIRVRKFLPLQLNFLDFFFFNLLI